MLGRAHQRQKYQSDTIRTEIMQGTVDLLCQQGKSGSCMGTQPSIKSETKEGTLELTPVQTKPRLSRKQVCDKHQNMEDGATLGNHPHELDVIARSTN